MKLRSAFSALAVLLFLLPAFGQPVASKPGRATAVNAQTASSEAASATSSDLPIRRVVLYKNGVGYFEHQAKVTGSRELNIRFTTAQLNDVLKSLTVVDLGGGRVGGVRYNSMAPLSQRLSTLRLPVEADTGRDGFLTALRGARVEVKSGAASATGRLLSVESVNRPDKEGNQVAVTQLTVVSDAGEVRSFDLTNATSVRILEADMTREAGRYLTLLASARDKDVRQMTISTSGDGTRDLLVSYISEVPVWKSTYRIVLPADAKSKPLLQGWAIVDNTVGEDWKNVQLSLVAGAPQSFVEQISQPYYVRRPVVELPKTAQLTPQTHEGGEIAAHVVAVESKFGETDDRARMGVANAMAAAPEQAKARRSGVGGGIAGNVGAQYSRVEVTDAEREQSFDAQSTGSALGDMFQYALTQPVTVLQNQSAMVPIVQARVEAEKVTLWNPRGKSPLRALWLTNSSGLTLDAGSFNIVEGGSFAGEGLLAEVHPAERRLISYAADTAVRVKSQLNAEQKPFTRLSAARGILKMTRELRETRTYTVTNSDVAARSVIIEHPARAGWHFLDAALKPEESSNSYHRFRLAVAPGTTSTLEVAEYYPQETTYQLSSINDNTINMVLKSGTPQPEVEAALRKLLAKKNEIAAVESAIKQRRDEINGINAEQARVRENMKALKGSAEEKALVTRYVASLNQQEDRLATLNKEISAKELELNARQSEYQQMAESLSFEQTR
jgi:hypothetical protein